MTQQTKQTQAPPVYVETPKEMNEHLFYAAQNEIPAVFERLKSTPRGLTDEEAEVRRDVFGPNKVARGKKQSLIGRIFQAFVSPFTAILLALAFLSAVTDIVVPLYQTPPGKIDVSTVVIILSMVMLSGFLRFVQETRSGNAAAKLLDMITTTTCVERDGEKGEIPLEEVVPGDIVHLAAGDMIPADVRFLETKDLFVTQAALTGESEHLEKFPAVPEARCDVPTECRNLGFMGANVVSGTASAVVVATADSTLFGSLARTLVSEPVVTTFEKGVNAVSWVLIRFMLVMAPLVFFLNGLTKGEWLNALFFAISIAVGLTPGMLPMIVTTCLAKGAVSMSKKKTIIKNLNSMQNFGAMDVLCTDKTGTLTQDKVALLYHMDVHGNRDVRVLRHAFLNSYFQTGLKNLMDVAIITRTEQESAEEEGLRDLAKTYRKVDEVPFDFARRRMSVVVADATGKTQMITKGAVEEMLTVCAWAEYQGEVEPMTEDLKREILETVDRLNEDGMRVVAVAQKTAHAPVGTFGVADENDMVLMGYLAFLDPPKETTAAAIRALLDHGVSTKVLTGDNDKVTRCICRQVGIEVKDLLLGPDIEEMDDEALGNVAEATSVFAKLSPLQKARVVRVLRDRGHTVGFMGDGINDAPAMEAADIGISVDTAVDIAKESADIVLLQKDLMVLEEGILEGRKTYANMIKYIKMTASSNFGNMFSVLVASAFLPFLPMMSLHLLLLNLIYDVSCSAIPWDNVDPEFLKVPRTWNAGSIGSFMIWMGPASSIFDITTYLGLYFFLCPAVASGGLLFKAIPAADAAMRALYVATFQAGWFVESMWTQTLVIHMLRTPKISFIQSRASFTLTALTCSGIALLSWIPHTGWGRDIGLAPLPATYWPFLLLTVAAYVTLVTWLKKIYVRRYGELL